MNRSSGRLEELSDLASEVPSDRIEDDVAVLGTLADETRYRIVRLLAAAEGDGGD